MSAPAIRVRVISISTGMMLVLAAAVASSQDVQSTRSSEVDWIKHGNTDSEQRFSPLAEINDQNVGKLGLAWSLDLPDARSIEATPLEVGGTLYFTTGYAVTYAVDAASGKLLWTYDPKSYEVAPRKLRMLQDVSRGVAYDNGRIFVGAKDGRLIALDAKTGKLLWSVETIAADDRKVISGAPRVFEGKVLIGNGVSEYSTRGYVTAYDQQKGRQLWRFFTVPGDPAKGFESAAMAMAAQTWHGDWWKWGGGGNPWNAMTFDRELHRVYIGTGNASPYDQRLRSPGGGDNLFTSSIVALDANTGQYIWHYQINPGESWDWKATMDIVLANLTIAGKPRKVLMQSPSNGFFYVLDRDTGKLISAEAAGKQRWAERIDLATGRPVERPDIRYQAAERELWPGPQGFHNWQPMSFSPKTGLVYIPTMQLGARYSSSDATRADARNIIEAEARHTGPDALLSQGVAIAPAAQGEDKNTGGLLAWDPIAQKARWQIGYRSLFNGGTMVTAGNLVFQGTALGDFIAYQADNGKKLWSFKAGLGIIAAPITYRINGRQFVSVLVGWGGGAAWGGSYLDHGWKYGAQPRRLLTFALDASRTLPPTAPPDFELHPIDDPMIKLDPEIVAEGSDLYHHSCVACHGGGLHAVAVAPDLRESHLAMNRKAMAAVLRQGLLASRGMPKYDDLSCRQIEALYQYIRDGARKARAR